MAESPAAEWGQGTGPGPEPEALPARPDLTHPDVSPTSRLETLQVGNFPVGHGNQKFVIFPAMQGMRDRHTLRTSYPLEDKSSPAGAVNPALQQLDFYIRSPERHAENHPDREVFDHFFAMEVTWR